MKSDISHLLLIGYILFDSIVGYVFSYCMIYTIEFIYGKKVDNKKKKQSLIFGTIFWVILGLIFEFAR